MSILQQINRILAVSIIPFHDVSVVCLVIPVADTHIFKVEINGISHDFHAFQVVPIGSYHGIRSQSSRDIEIVEIRHPGCDKGSPAVGADCHAVVIHSIIAEGERQINGVGAVVHDQMDFSGNSVVVVSGVDFNPFVDRMLRIADIKTVIGKIAVAVWSGRVCISGISGCDVKITDALISCRSGNYKSQRDVSAIVTKGFHKDGCLQFCACAHSQISQGDCFRDHIGGRGA